MEREIKLNKDQAKFRENLTNEWNLLSANNKKLLLDQAPMKNTNQVSGISCKAYNEHYVQW